MHAVILTGGKQYRVTEGEVLAVEKLEVDAGQKIQFDKVLLVEDGDKVLIGTPFLPSAMVRAEVVETYKGDKVLIFKKKRTKQFRRTRGHRQLLTRIKVERVFPDTTAVSPDELRAEAPRPPAAAPKKVHAPAPKAAKPKPAPAAKPKAPEKAAAKKKEAKRPAKAAAKAKRAGKE